MHNIWTLIKKELKRYFTDKRMIFSLFFPGILIFIVYSLMGNFITGQFEPANDYEYKIAVINDVNEFAPFYDNEELKITTTKYTLEDVNLDDLKAMVNNKEIDLIIYYEQDFINKVNAYDVTLGGNAPFIKMYYSSTIKESSRIYEYFNACFYAYENTIANKFDVNLSPDEKFDLASESDMTIMLITMILPFVLIIFLFSGAMAITPDSVAGEKERGTMATLLVTQIKRSELAIAKVLSLSIISLASACVSFIGLIASLPKLFGMANISLSVYTFGTYAAILAIIIVTVLMFVVVLTMVSTISKSVKEATSYGTVVMMLVMFCGILSMTGVAPSNIGMCFVPVYNSVLMISEIFSLQFNGIHFLITIVSDLLYVAIGIYLITKMFNSEKVMFSK